MKSSKINRGQNLWEKAKKIIPGGSQLLSKRSEMFLSGGRPSYYKKAKDVELLDLDGKKYIDMSIIGVGCCILGYTDTDVNRAVKKAVDEGSMTTLNSPEEVELAELLCDIHPWAKMVRFTRTGGEAMAVAVRIAHAHISAVLVFDEITIAWRMRVGGVHLKYGVNPDIAVFAKAISNGYPMAAIVGRRDVMQSAQDTFISSTYWTERIGPAAALVTIKKLKKERVPEHIKKIGAMIGDGWQRLAKKHKLAISIIGHEALITFSFNYGEQSQAIRTLFTQEMLARGFLASNSVYVSYAHKAHHARSYLKAVDEVFAIITSVIKGNDIQKLLKGPVAHSGFKRLT